jgi:hypothetical protein
MKRERNFLINAFAALILTLFVPTLQSYSQSLPYWEVPLFQYAIFYDVNLEVDPGGVFPIEGSVFSNAGIWSGTPNVTYLSTVWAAGQINTSGTDPYCSGKIDAGTPQSSFLVSGQPVSGLVPATVTSRVYLTSEPNITNAEVLINLPPINVRAPQSIAYLVTNQLYTFNAASLIVSNWYFGTNGVTPWSNNFTVYLQDNATPPFYLPANWIQLTNDFYLYSNSVTHMLYVTNQVPNFRFTSDVSSIQWTNPPTAFGPVGTNSVWYAGFSFLTNVTFNDYREQANVQAVQIDVGKLGAWITNSAANGGSNWNEELSEDTFHGINSVYVYNAVPFVGQQQLPAVRLVDGQLLPSSTTIVDYALPEFTYGLTVVTPQPLYVLGNYNVQTNGGPVVSGSHNTVNTYPAALMADSITILSSGWNDGYTVSTPLSARMSQNTTVNAACLEGIVPSSGANYSGGVENFLRLLENWNASVLTYNGSIAVMFPSIYATNFWPGSGSVYTTPVRNWAFDTNFYSLQGLPPLTPNIINSNTTPIIAAQPANEAVLAGQSTNFSVTAVGMPGLNYQWIFNGTNILGETNASLPLSDIQLNDDGNYAVQVTNILGSAISSNALLSIYTSAVPVLNALSFSESNGLQFSVSGVPGFNYAILASTNLTDWWPLTTNNSPFDFIDTNINFPERFYRSIYLP